MAGGDHPGLDRLREELTGYLDARAKKLAGGLGDTVSRLTGKLTEAAQEKDGGAVPGLAARVMKGETPVKAAMAETASGVKDKVAGKAKEAVGGGSSGSGGGGSSGTKATNIVEVLDIGMPLRSVYDQFTQFEQFSTFTKGVQSVKVSDDEPESDWQAKIGPSNRSWKATVQEQIPDDRIVWTSEGPKGTTHGAVSFHELGPNLTRLVAVIEYTPSGFFEKTANLWRAQGRRVRLDLKHFQRHVTLAEEEPEGWRGEIRDGEIVRSHEDAAGEDEPEEQNGESGNGEDQSGEQPEDRSGT